MRRWKELALFVLACWVSGAMESKGEEVGARPDGQVDFARDIQPLFQRACYSCHGPELEEGGLRLDLKQRALAGGEHGPILVPRDSGKSRLIRLVSGEDSDLGRMPPDGEGAPLTADQIGLLRKWIDQGATWPDHAKGATRPSDLWSLKPLVRPALPPVADGNWVANPVDRFVLARLEREKVAPAPSAAPITLLRRLHLDLIGLPPSPADVADFVANPSPAAYEQLVEQLLASPHFGERWGRHWLDMARYADSDGYEKDRPRPFAWRYRNWVLDAINSDLPFDQFTREQIAGDLLPQAALEHQIATGFHRNTLHNTEGGIDPEEDRVKKTVDRTNTIGTVWLGLTVGCAQCHSHKYDPLTHREYYQLYAFFNDIDETDIDAPLEAENIEYTIAKADFDRQHQPYLDAIARYESEEFAAAQSRWEKNALDSATVWSTLDALHASSAHGAKIEKRPDGSLVASGENKRSDTYTVEAVASPFAIRAIRLEVLPDASLPKKGPGRADNGNFVLADFQCQVVAADGTVGQKIALIQAKADFSQNQCDVGQAINDNPSDFWAVAPQMGKRHVAVFELEVPQQIPADAKLRVTLSQQYDQEMPHNLGRFRLSTTESQGELALNGIPASVASALSIEPSQRSADQSKKIAEYYRTIDPKLVQLKKAAEAHAKNAPAPPDTKAQAISQRKEPRPAHIHLRGDFLSPGESVEPRVPAWLPGLTLRGERPDRLDLASWLVSAQNPLTPRVTVNRIWERLFGRGIVATTDDFGSQSEPPTHPELLDWLASEFQDRQWSMKAIVRLIVLSNAYKQSSAPRNELMAIDPENTLLARQARRRVEAEIIRDLSLAASGLMDPRVGGPSVRPPQPAEYAELTYANSAKWTDSKGGDRYRRGMYTFFQRTSPYPMLVTFDSPDSNECCVQRETSNTPLQALTLWNDPAFFEFAQAIGRRIVRDVAQVGSDPETRRNRAVYGFQLCVARSPNPDELAEVLALFNDQLARYLADPDSAAKVNGAVSIPDGSSPADVAAWTIVGRSLLNLDEFITRE